VPWWISSGVIGGGVTSADSPISSFGATGPICSNSARQSAGGWNSLCLKANTAGAATISLQNYGTASSQPLNFVINGTPYTFPFSISGILGPNSSTVGDLAIWNNSSGTLLKDVSLVTVCGLNIFSSSLNGCVPASGGGITNFLRADGTWGAPATSNLVVGASAIAGGSNGRLLYDNNGFLGELTATGTPGGTISINPTVNSVNQGLVITQSSPTSGNSVGPLNYNNIQVTNTYHTTGAALVDGVDGTYINAFKVDLFAHGTNLGTSSLAAIFGHLHLTTSNIGSSGSDKIASLGFTYGNVVDSSAAGWSGMVGSVAVDVGGSSSEIEGGEFDVGIATGASAAKRFGVGIGNYGAVQATASNKDAAIAIFNFPDAAGITGSAAGAFQNLVLLSGQAGLQPLSNTADLFRSDTAYTVANVFNFAGDCSGTDPCNLTVTGNILNFPNIVITGGGVVKSGAGAIFNNGTGYQVQANIASGGIAQMISQTNSTAGFSGFVAETSLQTNTLSAVAIEPNFSATIFGLTGGNYVDVLAQGSANNGLLFGTTSNTPVTFGTNGTYAGRVDAAQNWLLGPNTTVTPGVRLSVNNNTLAMPNSGLTGTTMQIGGAVNTINRLVMNAVGSNPVNVIDFISSHGTFSSPTATQAGDTMGAFGAFGYGTTGYGLLGGSNIQFIANQTWTDTAQGTYFTFGTTPNGTVGIVTALTIQASGGVSVGTAADPGINSIAAANYFAGSTAGVTCGAGLSATTARTVKGIVTAC
jgi:hypothetical protein